MEKIKEIIVRGYNLNLSLDDDGRWKGEITKRKKSKHNELNAPILLTAKTAELLVDEALRKINEKSFRFIVKHGLTQQDLFEKAST